MFSLTSSMVTLQWLYHEGTVLLRRLNLSQSWIFKICYLSTHIDCKKQNFSLIHKELAKVMKWLFISWLISDNLTPIKRSAEFRSKIVAVNSAKKTYPFCLNLSFLSQNALLCELGFLQKCLNSFWIPYFWKNCLNSDEISKFRVCHR